MFYQMQPDVAVYFKITDHSWRGIATHLHGFFELHCCVEGQMRLTVDGKDYVLHGGEAALIFPYQPHSFPAKEGKGHFYTFDSELIGTFASEYANCVPRNHVFPFSYDYSQITGDSDIYQLKSFLYAVCHCAAQLEYDRVPVESRVLLEKILLITEDHFTESEFSLGKLAQMLDYDYGYVSKYFYQKTGMKYGCYLNQRRIALAVRFFNKGISDNISDVAFACGYSSVRSFNRNFKRIENMAPQEYLCSNNG